MRRVEIRTARYARHYPRRIVVISTPRGRWEIWRGMARTPDRDYDTHAEAIATAQRIAREGTR